MDSVDTRDGPQSYLSVSRCLIVLTVKTSSPTESRGQGSKYLKCTKESDLDKNKVYPHRKVFEVWGVLPVSDWRM